MFAQHRGTAFLGRQGQLQPVSSSYFVQIHLPKTLTHRELQWKHTEKTFRPSKSKEDLSPLSRTYTSDLLEILQWVLMSAALSSIAGKLLNCSSFKEIVCETQGSQMSL